ncbi:MAG: tail fiber domain-containing protein, partial [Elusimicrobiales bacterium]|nr:tail fiber domain-containing protein [Elusimicrobiales bacterium]
ESGATYKGSENVFVGISAGQSNNTGYYNAFVGRAAGTSNTTGANNVAVGNRAGYSNTTGAENVFVGQAAGRFWADGATALETPADSVYIGYAARGYNNSDSNSIVIGANAIGIGANTVVLGNSNILTTVLRGSVGIGTTAPSAKLHVSGGDLQVGGATASTISASGYITLPAIAQPTGSAGRIYYDATSSKLRAYNSAWADLLLSNNAIPTDMVDLSSVTTQFNAVITDTNAIAGNLTTEIANRVAGDLAVGVATGTLAGRFQQVWIDTNAIASNLTTEIANRVAGDLAIGVTTGTIAGNLTTETNARVAGDLAVGVATGTLAGRFQQVWIDTNAIAGNLTTEIANRVAGDLAIGVTTGTIAGNLTTEIANREAGDLAVGVTTGTIAGNLTTETTNREAGDLAVGVATGTLASRLTTVASDTTTIAGNVSTLNTALAGKLNTNGTNAMAGQLTVNSTVTITGNAFSVNSTDLVVSGGNVGIGTSAPNRRLSVFTPSATDFQISVGDIAGSPYTYDIGRVSAGTPAGYLKFYGNQTGGVDGYVFSGVTGEKLRILPGGSVGIGATAPGAKLDVNGDAQFGPGATKSTFTAAGNLTLPYGITAATATFSGAVSVGALSGTPGNLTQYVSLSTVTTQFNAVITDTNAIAGNLTTEIANRVAGDLAVGVATGTLAGRFVQVWTDTNTIAGNLTTETNARVAGDLAVGVTTGTIAGNLTTEIANRVAGDLAIGVATGTLVGGSGTASYVPKFMASQTLANSLIYDNGTNVGIGTTAPAVKLDVNGDAQFGSGATKSTFTTAGVLQIGATGASTYGVDISSGLLVRAGNVGIGTTNPVYDLTVVNRSDSTKQAYFDASGTWGPQLNLKNSVAQTTLSGYGTTPYMGTVTNHPFYFVTNNAYRWGVSAAGGIAFGGTYYNVDPGVNNMIISGNVGIGTTVPAQKLDVAGKINFNTSGQNATINNYYGADSAGNNIFIGDGGQSSVGATGQTYKGATNTFVGVGAGYSNTTGYQNTFIGGSAGNVNNTGFANVIIGMNAGLSNTSGLQNTIVGPSAGLYNTSGYNNVVIGIAAGNNQAGGSSLQTAHDSVYIGASARGYSNSDNNSIVIGASAIGIGANTAVLGSDSIVTTALKGNVGIGTTVPGAVLDVNGAAQFGSGATKSTFTAAGVLQAGATGASTYGVDISSGLLVRAGSVGIGTASPSQMLEVNGTAKMTDIILTSDRRMKTDIAPLDGRSALDKVMKLKPVSFRWKTSHLPDMGVIAQDLQQVFPDLVITNPDGMLSVRSMSLISPVIAALQELEARNRALEAKVKALEADRARMDRLEQENKEIKAALDSIRRRIDAKQ